MKVLAEYLLSFSIVSVLFHKSLSVNILAVTTLASPSHHLWHRVYLLALVQRGHNVTVLGHDKEKTKISNFTMLTLEGVYDKIHKDFVMEDLVYEGPLQSIKSLWDWDELSCTYDLEADAMKTLLNYPKDYKFDLIIWDLNGGRCQYPLIERFGSPPVIATSPFGLQPFIGYILGYHITSYIPFYQAPYTDQMTFLERLTNFVYVHVMNLSRRYYLIPREYEISKKYFGTDVPALDDVERKMSLLLVNTDPIMNYVEQLPPNIVPVGGIHIQAVNQLPKDLQMILDEAKHGVILVSFGTNLNWLKFGQTQRDAFLETFRRLPQTILMKSVKCDLDLSKNIIIREWLPQNDVLAHPNVKLFITHGGALSTQEAMYHGVPVVGMPFFIDQHGNMAKIELKALGKRITYFDATTDFVFNTITEVVNNPLYRTNMQTLSKRYKDQPQTPLERAVFWTEYVLRHGSAEHLSPATRDMSIIQRYDLDIAFLFMAGFVVLFAVFYYLLKCLFDLCRLRNSNNRNKIKNN